MDLSGISESYLEEVSVLVIQMLVRDRTNYCENYFVFRESLAAKGINSEEFPGAIENFWMDIREFNNYYIPNNYSNIRNIVGKMLLNIRSTTIAKDNLYQYLNLIVNGINDSIHFDYGEEVLSNTLLKAATEMASLDPIYSLTIEEAGAIFDNIIYEDVFLAYLSYICIRFHHNKVKFNPRRSSKSIPNFFRKFQVEYLPYLTDRNLEPEKKIIGRHYCINNFYRPDDFYKQLKKIIKRLKKRQLESVSSERLAFFSEISKSAVIKNAIGIFSEQTLQFPNPPFINKDTAYEMFSYAFGHIANNKKTFHSSLFENALGLTVYEYVFINRAFKEYSSYTDAFALITLIHETAHLYKRVTQSGIMKSPSHSTMVLINGISEEKPEDGWRLENILFPGFSGEIYLSAAIFLTTSSSWNQSLNAFTDQFKLLQKKGEDSGESSFRYRKTNNIALRCIRLINYS